MRPRSTPPPAPDAAAIPGGRELQREIIAGLRRRESTIDFQTASDAGILGLPDPQVLAIAAREGRILLSHDRQTMPGHFHQFVAGSASSGVIIVSQTLAIREAIEEILTVWGGSAAEEWLNHIGFLPL